MHLIILNYRLEPETDEDATKIYIFPRLIAYATATLWAFSALYFRLWIYMVIKEVCPGGNLAAIGGRKKKKHPVFR